MKHLTISILIVLLSAQGLFAQLQTRACRKIKADRAKLKKARKKALRNKKTWEAFGTNPVKRRRNRVMLFDRGRRAQGNSMVKRKGG